MPCIKIASWWPRFKRKLNISSTSDPVRLNFFLFLYARDVPSSFFQLDNMASCYGGDDLSEDCDGLDGQDKLAHILPIRWKREG